jgi:hypothetical protein
MFDRNLIPGFVSPLTDEQHAQLGRIAVLWGQCDMLLDDLLTRLHRLTKEQKKAFIGEKPIGPKLELLKPKLNGIRDPHVKERIGLFYDILNNTKAKRNHIFHGSWGWREMNRDGDVRVCARHPKAPANPVFASELPELEKQLCRASRAGTDAMLIFNKQTPPEGATRYLHGRGRKPSKWFLRWLEQHPLDAANLDHSCKAGQLLRLVDPLK